jgi:hypothetical protein
MKLLIALAKVIINIIESTTAMIITSTSSTSPTAVSMESKEKIASTKTICTITALIVE